MEETGLLCSTSVAPVDSIRSRTGYRTPLRSSSGAVTEIISDTPAADIGFDAGRSRVLIPQLDNNRLLIYPVDLD